MASGMHGSHLPQKMIPFVLGVDDRDGTANKR